MHIRLPFAVLVNIRYFFPFCHFGKVTNFIPAEMCLSVFSFIYILYIAGKSNTYMLKTSKTSAQCALERFVFTDDAHHVVFCFMSMLLTSDSNVFT